MRSTTRPASRITDLGAVEAHSEAQILADAIAELQQLDTGALQKRWRSLMGCSLPFDLGRPLTLRILAYKLQAQHLGDLDRASLRELTSLAGQKTTAAPLDMNVPGMSAGGRATPIAAGKPVSLTPARIARPGTLLVREHGGDLHRVMVQDEGVTWNGKTYDSLSKVAFAITGTRWNGPRFFGLRSPSKADGVASQSKAQAVDPAAAGQVRNVKAQAAPRATPHGTSP